MIINKYHRYSVAAIFMVLVALAGCRSSTTPLEFYTLSPMPVVSEADKVVGLGDNLAVGVGPLQIPKIIDRPQIVTRRGPNKIEVDEFHRWAGSVYEDFLRAVTMNLSALLQSSLVLTYPWEEYFEPDYRVYMEVHQFDGLPGQYAQLDITWTIIGRDDRRILLVKKSSLKEPAPGADFTVFVAAKSRLLAKLSRQIAQGIQEVHGTR
jgi:uncharacterized lipoprotein YmbA